MLSPIKWIKPRLRPLCVLFGATDMTLVLLSGLCWYFVFNSAFEAQDIQALYRSQQKNDLIRDPSDADDEFLEIKKFKDDRTQEELRLERTIRACGYVIDENNRLDETLKEENLAGPASMIGAAMGSYFILGALLTTLNSIEHPAARRVICGVALFGEGIATFFLFVGVAVFSVNESICRIEYFYEYFQPVLYLLTFTMIFIFTYKIYEVTIIAFYLGQQSSAARKEEKVVGTLRRSTAGRGSIGETLKHLRHNQEAGHAKKHDDMEHHPPMTGGGDAVDHHHHHQKSEQKAEENQHHHKSEQKAEENRHEIDASKESSTILPPVPQNSPIDNNKEVPQRANRRSVLKLEGRGGGHQQETRKKKKRVSLAQHKMPDEGEGGGGGDVVINLGEEIALKRPSLPVPNAEGDGAHTDATGMENGEPRVRLDGEGEGNTEGKTGHRKSRHSKSHRHSEDHHSERRMRHASVAVKDDTSETASEHRKRRQSGSHGHREGHRSKGVDKEVRHGGGDGGGREKRKSKTPHVKRRHQDTKLTNQSLNSLDDPAKSKDKETKLLARAVSEFNVIAKEQAQK